MNEPNERTGAAATEPGNAAATAPASPTVIVITGASDGIGAEMARQWSAARRGGIALVLAARNVEKLEAVAASCRANGSQVRVQRCDVAHAADCRALIGTAVDTFGRIDTLVNNAGMSAHANLADVGDLDWYETLMRINHWGSVWCTHAALPHLLASRGRIVAVASLAGLVGVPGRTAYSATKFAMVGFFESLRTELLEGGVSVTIAYPGVVATEIRRRGFDASGRAAGRSGLDERDAMPVETCARLIVEGTERRRRDIVMSGKGRLGRWLKLVAPGYVDRLALKALNREGGA
ncbi:SDR family oxidoreductase [Piscinibacter koreensis]|uniref:SDR family oxidoreductase n=1 Tax=Piscinibacter koreensis TaxID=2742824 RepID=A0A7Y6NKS9_9BURK|nr:SDR family oxidoreductase [Schlegelella koreensis]NUZ05026.1 SDR family oxidoreductase [Schlegelella koreensis]